MVTILTDKFKTELGTICNWIETDDSTSILLQDDYRVVTKGHEIVVQPFDLTGIWKSEIWQIETSKGWRWFIQKTGKQKEQLTIYCKLVPSTSDIKYDPDSGEHLDAIEIENNTHHLNIGTEDGEVMHYRAIISDWMPKRFENKVGLFNSFTEYTDFGFKTVVPDLVESEKIYFHFIVATDLVRPSKEFPDERDISTWYAVDKSKLFLDEKLENTAGNNFFPG